MNNQEAFDKAVGWLLAQGRRSAVTSNYADKCRYRGPDGLRCAVGALIPDEEYREGFEGERAYNIAGLVPALTGVSLDLLECMQKIHDNASPSGWKEDYKNLAEDFRLEWNFDFTLGEEKCETQDLDGTTPQESQEASQKLLAIHH